MASSKDTIKTILHYKKSLEPPHVDNKRILHCLGVLQRLSLTVNLLQETGIGRTVNGLCKVDSNEVRTAAKGLVNKWKELVVNESEDEPAQHSQGEQQDGERHSQRKDTGKIKEERHSRSHHHQKSSSSSKGDKESRHHHHRDTTNNMLSSSSSSKAAVIDGESAAEKPHHRRDHHKKSHRSSSDHHRSEKEARKRPGEESSHKEKSSKRHRKEVTPTDEAVIDGSAGTSFADALAMMDGASGATTKSSKSSSSKVTTSLTDSSVKTKATPISSSSKSVSQAASASSSSSSSSTRPTGKDSVSQAKNQSLSRPSDSGSGPPKMLAPSVKLAPLLDPEELRMDILGPSVVISNSYTPSSYLNPGNLPGVSAAIMKNKRTSGQSCPPPMDANNFEILQSKARTKVYSGNKGAATVLSLHEMCIRVLQKNVDALEYTGGVPFDILEPILLKCTAPQLEQIEYYNPYLMEDTNDLWKMHVQRQFRTKKRQEMESWREMYQRCQQEDQDRLSSLTESFKQSKQTATPVRQTKLAYMDQKNPPMGRRRGMGGGGGTSSGPSISASLSGRTSVNGTRMGFLTAGREVQAKRAPLMQKTLALMKKSIKR